MRLGLEEVDVGWTFGSGCLGGVLGFGLMAGFMVRSGGLMDASGARVRKECTVEMGVSRALRWGCSVESGGYCVGAVQWRVEGGAIEVVQGSTAGSNGRLPGL